MTMTMKKRLDGFVVMLLVVVMLCVSMPAQQVQQVGPLDGVTLTAVGFAPRVDASLPLPDRIVLTAIVTGSPTVCTFTIYGTLKGINDVSLTNSDFEQLATPIACDVTAVPGGRITLFVNDKLMRTLMPDLVTLSGGTSPAVKFVLMYRGQKA